MNLENAWGRTGYTCPWSSAQFFFFFNINTTNICFWSEYWASACYVECTGVFQFESSRLLLFWSELQLQSRTMMLCRLGSTMPRRGLWEGSPFQQASISCQHSSSKLGNRSGLAPGDNTSTRESLAVRSADKQKHMPTDPKETQTVCPQTLTAKDSFLTKTQQVKLSFFRYQTSVRLHLTTWLSLNFVGTAVTVVHLFWRCSRAGPC